MLHIEKWFVRLFICSVVQYDVRLVNGASNKEGRVELFYNGEWGTICDDLWGLEEAFVVCRQLGYPVALGAPGNARFGAGAGNIWLDNTNCNGNERNLSECVGDFGDASGNCRHSEDAGVICESK